MKSRVSCRDETSPVGNLALSVTAEHGRLAVDASSICHCQLCWRLVGSGRHHRHQAAAASHLV